MVAIWNGRNRGTNAQVNPLRRTTMGYVSQSCGSCPACIDLEVVAEPR